MKNKIILNMPCNIKILIWKKIKNNFNNIILFNNHKYYVLTFNKNIKINIDKWFNSIIIINNDLNYNYIKLNNIFNFFIKSWNIYFFNKIKFKGKGFRIKFFKKIKLIKFYFGKSHKTFYLLKKIKRKKINKYKFILLSINNEKLTSLSKKIVKIKKINNYTLRGLRISREIIFKRKGKKGTYI